LNWIVKLTVVCWNSALNRNTAKISTGTGFQPDSGYGWILAAAGAEFRHSPSRSEYWSAFRNQPAISVTVQRQNADINPISSSDLVVVFGQAINSKTAHLDLHGAASRPAASMLPICANALIARWFRWLKTHAVMSVGPSRSTSVSQSRCNADRSRDISVSVTSAMTIERRLSCG